MDRRAADYGSLACDDLVITCEHGGNRIPAPYRDLFHAHQALLDSHRGYDPGTLIMARALATAFAAPLMVGIATRVTGDLRSSIPVILFFLVLGWIAFALTPARRR